MTDHPVDDPDQLLSYTGRARINKAANTLNGLLAGLTADGSISNVEAKRLAEWITEHREFARHKPFDEVIRLLGDLLRGSSVTADSVEDLRWFCMQCSADNPYYDSITGELQTLQGIMDGILADGKITEDELAALSDWMEDHRHLASCWPFDEIDAVVTAVLSDGKIDEREHELLTYMFSDFVATGAKRSLENVEVPRSYLLSGVCALDPEFRFQGNRYCFTGQSRRAKRSEIQEIVESLGGEFVNTVSKAVDYLVVGADGSDCWAFSCYGRKVEQAVRLRREGHRLFIANELDFWDAVENHRV